MIRYLEWACALYRAAQEHGMNRTDAGELVETVMLDLYRPVPATMFRLSRLRSAATSTRAAWLLRNQLRFFFTEPFRYRHHRSESGLAFDVIACPLADYFEAQGVPELTAPAACRFDYLMAAEYGVELVRTRTIANGADDCDFRWRFPTAAR